MLTSDQLEDHVSCWEDLS